MSVPYRSPFAPIPDLTGEEWRDWSDHWQVSNLGRFKAKAREVRHARGVTRLRERLLKLHDAGHPGRHIPTIAYQHEKVRGQCSIYRAMWIAFVGELRPNQQVICQGSIRVENLRLIDSRDTNLGEYATSDEIQHIEQRGELV